MDDNDYTILRQKNISERNNIFAELFHDIKEQGNNMKKLWDEQLDGKVDVEYQLPKKRRRTSRKDSNKDETIRVRFCRSYNTRNHKNTPIIDDDDSENDDENGSRKRKNDRDRLTVMFPWAKPIQRSIDFITDTLSDEEEDNYSRKRRKRGYRSQTSIRDLKDTPSVDEITQEILDNVAETFMQKTYCRNNGTSCHQCRQKTIDTKTVCRSETCIGMRGQFCGPCLKGRYGESVVEALKDPNWICPPCRNLCNCSICRTKNGYRPTGSLAVIAKNEGYSSVMEYLQENGNDSSE